MLVMFSALIVTMSAPFQNAATFDTGVVATPVRPSLSGRDSSRALKAAQRAQGDFEVLRRRLLPYEPNGGGGCDDVVGNYCYRQQFTVPPREDPQVIVARARLLETLENIGTMIPGDRWVLGQRLRYLLEAGRPNTADSMAVACAARTTETTASWCLALVGYTAQQMGNFTRAEAAFGLALDWMSEPERCKWQDLTVLFGRSAGGSYRRGDCGMRDSANAGFWRLVQPLYLTTVNDLRTEFLARMTRMYIEQGTRTAMSDWWGRDDRETLLRYGAPLWYTRGEMVPGQVRPQITGFRREPAFNFFPDERVFGSPERMAPEDWEFSSRLNTATYAPRWASAFVPILDHQVAFFRRGDSAFIVAAFDSNDGAPGQTRQAGVFAAVIDRGGVLAPVGTTVEKAGLNVITTLTAPWRPMVVSLEVLNSTSRIAGRARFAPKLPDSGPRLSLSDLLLYTPRGSAPTSLKDAVPRALHAMRSPSNRQIGVFWETYGVRPNGESIEYALVVTPADRNFFQRALVKMHITDPDQAVSLQWRERPSSASGIVSRGLTVDLSRLRPGRYSMRLMLTSGTDVPIVAERTIDIL